jgi:hypothetical protein
MNDPFERAVWREKLERRERRTRHVAAAFRTHLMIFVVVSAGIVLLWLVDNATDDRSSWDDRWFPWWLVGWGIGLALHWWSVRAHTRRDQALRARLDEPGAAS